MEMKVVDKNSSEKKIGPDGNKIIEHTTEGNVLYPGQGKKCDYCDCYFSCSYDVLLHLEAFGRKPHSLGARFL
jgi:hypothetical protein